MGVLKYLIKRIKRNRTESKYTPDDHGVVRTVGEDDPLEEIESTQSQSNAKLFFVVIGIVVLITGGAVAAVLLVPSPCIDNWTSWSGFDSCSDRGAGPYKRRRERSKFDSAVCAQDGHSVQYEYEYQDCDYTNGTNSNGTNGFWGTGKFKFGLFLSNMNINLGHYCGQELANMIIYSQNGCHRHDPAVSTCKRSKFLYHAKLNNFLG